MRTLSRVLHKMSNVTYFLSLFFQPSLSLNAPLDIPYEWYHSESPTVMWTHWSYLKGRCGFKRGSSPAQIAGQDFTTSVLLFSSALFDGGLCATRPEGDCAIKLLSLSLCCVSRRLRLQSDKRFIAAYQPHKQTVMVYYCATTKPAPVSSLFYTHIPHTHISKWKPKYQYK